jgi:hypothetical protein
VPDTERIAPLLDSLFRALGLKQDLGLPIIIVSGLPRSGTSMMMNMLTAANLEIVSDRVRTADEDNPKGYFEDERVKDLEKSGDRAWLRDCRGKVIKIISFLLKDLPPDNRYKVIFMRRDLNEVMASQNKMLRRRGEPVDESSNQKMIELYRSHLEKVDFSLRNRPNVEYVDIEYREAVADPRVQAERVVEFLGLDLDVDRMAQAVDPALYRNRG